MKLSVLLALAVTVARWSVTAVELSCEPVKLESPEPLCQTVTSPEDCIEVGEQGNSKPGCYLEPEACPANKLNYNRVEVDDDGYSITGLPNFADDSSHIGYCPQKPDGAWDTGGCLPTDNSAQSYHVDKLSIRFSPVDTLHYNITVSWNYPPFPWPDGAVFRLLVKTLEARPEHYYCVCINGTLSLTEHFLIVKYDPVNPVSDRNFVEASIVTFPHRSSSESDSSEIYQSDGIPLSCADTKNIHYRRSRCAIPHHGKPRNVKLNVIGTVTRLSWDKPCYQHPNACRLLEMDSSGSRSDPDTYYLTATVNNITHYFIIYNTTAVVLHTTHLQDFKLYTQTPCSKRCHPFANGCSEPATLNDTNNDTCCRTQPTTTVTPIPSVTNTPTTEHPSVTQSTTVKSESRTGSNGVIAAVVVVVVLVSAAGLVVLIVLLVYNCYCRRGEPVVTDILSTSPSPDLSPPPPSSTLLSETVPSVLVVFSPRTNHEESQVIRQCLIDYLADCNIEASAYGMYEMRQSPTEWIVEQQKKANAMLCVCNREFFEDWSSPSLDHNPKVVLTLKQLFQGDLQKGSSGVEPYAVIKMRPTDSQYIPPLLKSRPSYMYNHTRDIAHFAHNKPIYA